MSQGNTVKLNQTYPMKNSVKDWFSFFFFKEKVLNDDIRSDVLMKIAIVLLSDNKKSSAVNINLVVRK